MKLKKPNFWDYKKPNLISYLLLPLTLPLIINNFFLNFKKQKKFKKIKSICVGNIYVGGTAKTPLTIKINQILKKINLRSATIKKFYINQIDEQKLLEKKTKLYCYKNRKQAINQAIKDAIDIAVFDDGLQDLSINYDLNFVCFNNLTWVGNGFLIPAGPMREKLKSLKKYDAVFLNGNGENISKLKPLIRKFNKKIKIFETFYKPKNIKKFTKKEKYLIFSGIGNPESFKKTLVNNNFNIIKEVIFPDHYQYNSNDINNIKKLAKEMHAKIITTEKDYIKLNSINNKGINFLEIELVIKKEKELINFIKANI
jgi:tetraacyldisaccharide 4'-kinase